MAEYGQSLAVRKQPSFVKDKSPFDGFGISPERLEQNLDSLCVINPAVKMACQINKDYHAGNKRKARQAIKLAKKGRYGKRRSRQILAALSKYGMVNEAEKDRIKVTGDKNVTIGLDLEKTINKLKLMAIDEARLERLEEAEFKNAKKISRILKQMMVDSKAGKFGPGSEKIYNLLSAYARIEKEEKEKEDIEISGLLSKIKKGVKKAVKKVKKTVKKIKKNKYVNAARKVAKVARKVAKFVPGASVAANALDEAESIGNEIDKYKKQAQSVVKSHRDIVGNAKSIYKASKHFSPGEIKKGLSLIKGAKELDPSSLNKVKELMKLGKAGNVKALNTLALLDVANGVQKTARGELGAKPSFFGKITKKLKAKYAPTTAEGKPLLVKLVV